jgi:2-dehydropantoate 2-reductase
MEHGKDIFSGQSLPPINIVGAGGIGCSLGATIHHAGHPVKLIETCYQKISWAKKHGVQVSGIPAQIIPIQNFESWKPHHKEINLICLKSYNNKFIRYKNINWKNLITVQNGFEPSLLENDRIGEGIASYIAECDPKKTLVRITRPGDLHLGTFRGKEAHLPFLKRLSKLIRIPKVNIRLTDDITRFKYTKFLYNCAISPLASGCGIDNGQLLAHPKIRPLFLDLLRENLGILEQAKIQLGRVGPFAPQTVVAILKNPWITRFLASWFQKSLSKTYCSMACDWSTGETELEDYLGHLIRLAGNTPCPLNTALYHWCKDRLSRRMPPSMELVSVLEEARSAGPRGNNSRES